MKKCDRVLSFWMQKAQWTSSQLSLDVSSSIGHYGNRQQHTVMSCDHAIRLMISYLVSKVVDKRHCLLIQMPFKGNVNQVNHITNYRKERRKPNCPALSIEMPLNFCSMAFTLCISNCILIVGFPRQLSFRFWMKFPFTSIWMSNYCGVDNFLFSFLPLAILIVWASVPFWKGIRMKSPITVPSELWVLMERLCCAFIPWAFRLLRTCPIY